MTSNTRAARLTPVLAALSLSTACERATFDGQPTDPFSTDSVTTRLSAPARGITTAAGRVAVTLEFSGEVLLLRESGGGRFEEDGRLSVGAGPRAIIQSGPDEVITANTTGQSLTAVELTPLALTATVALGVAPIDVAASDLDGDGTMELLVAHEGGLLVLWRREGAFAPGVQRYEVPGLERVAEGDVDADGDADVVLVRSARDEVTFLENDGAGHLAEAGTVPVCGSPTSAAVTPDASVLVTCRKGGLARIEGLRPAAAYQHDGSLYDVAEADLNGDGRRDFAAVDELGHGLSLWLGDGQGSFRRVDHEAGRGPIRVETIDLGQDGDLDLVVVAYESRTIEVLTNQTKGDGM